VTAYLARVGSAEIEVVVEGDGDTLRASSGGRTRRVDVAEIAPGWYSLIVEGVSHDLGIVPDPSDDGTLGGHGPVGARRSTLVLDGELYTVEVLRGRRGTVSRSRAAGAPGGSEVRAPMPGLLVAVRVAEGAEVTSGQPLVIMEAMKMQMEIRSPAEGIVRRVHVEAGVEITGGQVLVTIG
jgi:hypothetical protein